MNAILLKDFLSAVAADSKLFSSECANTHLAQPIRLATLFIFSFKLKNNLFFSSFSAFILKSYYNYSFCTYAAKKTATAWQEMNMYKPKKNMNYTQPHNKLENGL